MGIEEVPEDGPIVGRDHESMSDVELVDLVLKCDEKAAEVLFNRYYDPVYATAQRRLRSQAEAECAAVDAFADAFTHLEQYDRERPFSNWMMRIASNRANKYYNSKSGAAALAVGIDEPDVHIDQNLSTGSAQDVFESRKLYLEGVAVVQRLPPKQATVCTLLFLVGLSVAEVAQVLNISEDGVRVDLMRARKVLREHFLGGGGNA